MADLFNWGLTLAHSLQLDYAERRLALTAIMLAPILLSVCLIARWVRR